MKSEAVEFGTQARLGGFVCARQALQAQHLLSRSSPERKAVEDCVRISANLTRKKGCVFIKIHDDFDSTVDLALTVIGAG